jgi:hypothetical protein
MFVFQPDRKGFPGLKARRNIHFDNRNKKTFPKFLADSKLNFKRCLNFRFVMLMLFLIDNVTTKSETCEW